jgi:hypothetical protein
MERRNIITKAIFMYRRIERRITSMYEGGENKEIFFGWKCVCICRRHFFRNYFSMIFSDYLLWDERSHESPVEITMRFQKLDREQNLKFAHSFLEQTWNWNIVVPAHSPSFYCNCTTKDVLSFLFFY